MFVPLESFYFLDSSKIGACIMPDNISGERAWQVAFGAALFLAGALYYRQYKGDLLSPIRPFMPNVALPDKQPFDYEPTDYGPVTEYNEEATGGTLQGCNGCGPRYSIRFFSSPEAQAAFFGGQMREIGL